jgi:hypothetical protein
MIFAPPPPAIAVRGHVVSTFHLCGAAGLFAGCALAAFLTVRLGLSADVMMAATAAGLAMMLVLAYGARVALGHERLASYHHLIAVSAVAALFARAAGVPVAQHVASFVVSLLLLQGVGRIGCLAVGCCHGMPSGWGVRYHTEHVAAGFSEYLAGVPLVPVQVFEAMGATTIGLAGAVRLIRGAAGAEVLLVAVGAYALQRVVIECYRGDPNRLRIAGVTEAQWTSVLLLLVSTAVALTTGAQSRIAILLLATGAIAALIGRAVAARRRPWSVLLEPDHVLELAGALDIVCGGIELPGPLGSADLHVATTSRGISLSSAEIGRGAARGRQYTMSRATAPLTEQEARRLAALVMQLRHPAQRSTIVRAKRTGAYHLLVTRGATAPST